ncbi:hypothetical protein YC2023_049083 [Brassica napus]
MLETNSGLRGSDGSFSGKAQATSSNSTLGISTSQIVVMAGRWMIYDNGAWDFKIDNDRMGIAVDCSSIKGVCGAAPVEIATDTDYKIFKALHRTDKSFNIFVTFREIDGGEMIFLRSERDIFTKTNATAVIVDDDENLIRQVEAINAAIGLNFETIEVGGSKDSRAAADGVCGVNLEAENIRQQSCGEQILVQQGKNKQANVEAASGDDIGNVAGCAVMDVDKRKDEDDDFEGCPPKGRRGGWSDRNSYKRPGWRGGRSQGYGKPASGRGQRSRATGGSSSSKNRSNMRRYVELTDDKRDFLCTSRIVAVAYTEETDISLDVDVVHAPAKDMNQPNHRFNFVYSRLSKRCTLTFETATVETVDVAAVTPPQQKKKHNRVIEDDDEFVDPPLTETAKVCNSTCASDETHSADSVVNVLVSPQKQYKNKTVEKDTWESDEDVLKLEKFAIPPVLVMKNFLEMKKDTGESDDDVLVTPPKQYNTHNRVIEADDEFVEPPLTEPAKVCNSTSACDEKLSGDEKETGESDDDVLVTPPKQYNKHNRVIEADYEFVIGISGR